MLSDKELIHIYKKTDTSKSVGLDVNYGTYETDADFVLMFEGSASVLDWMLDLFAFRIPYKNKSMFYIVHSGFCVAWKSANDFFLNMIKEKIAEWKEQSIEKTVHIIGHSLGAAIATLCMEDVIFNYKELHGKLNLVTYGCPRVYGIFNHKKIVKRFKEASRVMRYVNGCDMVPAIPFFPSFMHICKATKVGEKWSLKRFFKHAFTDHGPSEYRDALDIYYPDSL
jgi:predicted lipase